MVDPNIPSSPYPKELQASDHVIALQAQAFDSAVRLNLTPVTARTAAEIYEVDSLHQLALDAATEANISLITAPHTH
jgi:hypothetical protein